MCTCNRRKAKKFIPGKTMAEALWQIFRISYEDFETELRSYWRQRYGREATLTATSDGDRGLYW